MKKEQITVEMLKEITKEYIRQENDEMENSTDYAYFALEPKLLKNEEVTTEFLKQSSKDEYDAIAYLFYDIVYKFQSLSLIDLIESLYSKFHGENDSEFYNEYVDNLQKCIKENKKKWMFMKK